MSSHVIVEHDHPSQQMTPDVTATDVRRRWATRSSAYSPSYYAYYGPDERSELIHEILSASVGRDAAILEPGCSSGRHLAYLAERGYRDLVGIDVNEDAVEVLERTYPDLAATGTFYNGALESVLPSFADDRFDAVYSVETLQHLHPDCEWLFDELARVTESVLVTAEIEPDDDARDGPDDGVTVCRTTVDGLPLYKRRWDRVFADRGFVERRATDLERVTVRTFRSATG